MHVITFGDQKVVMLDVKFENQKDVNYLQNLVIRKILWS